MGKVEHFELIKVRLHTWDCRGRVIEFSLDGEENTDFVNIKLISNSSFQKANFTKIIIGRL